MAGISPSRTVVLWCPDWPVVAALREAGLPADTLGVVAVADRVRVATSAARAEGIRSGMRRRDAQYRCPQVVVIPADPDRDARAFEPIAAAVDECAPGIEVLRPGLVACSVRGPAGYFGSETAAAEGLVDVIEAQGVECRAGIADGLETAVLAARRETIVVPGGDAAFCGALPLAELARDPALAMPAWEELVGSLRRLGIGTAAQFAALPLDKVVTRFGGGSAAMYRLATGVAERGISRRPDNVELAVGQTCDPPLERVDAAAFVARGLAERFHTRLAAAGLACVTLTVNVTTDRGETRSRTWRCATPFTATAVADRLRWQLDGWLTRGEIGAIVVLGLAASEVCDPGRIQHGLWGTGGHRAERTGAAFARVQGLLGPDAVLMPICSGGRSPLDRVAMVGWGEQSTLERDPAAPWPGALPAPAPARAGTTPMPCAVATESDSSPTSTPDSSPMSTPDAMPDAMPGSLPESTSASAPVPGPNSETIPPQWRPSRPAHCSPMGVCDAAGNPISVTDRGMLTGSPATVAGRAVLWWAGPWLVDERWWSGQSVTASARRRARVQIVTDSGPPVLLGFGPHGWHFEAVYD